ncbi:unnamed protein product [Bemisia tabaci]|uniref:CS domain-containing protein n=1 Tax=Bemisia tabaci TaxID=7038 RepID=A0A9P0F602_BEMTA|nr:unnamed protein product [Bemisia tabaci]
MTEGFKDYSATYDEFFCGILSSEGDITSFLNAVFGFLYRRTDFFTVQEDCSSAIGFPPGVAEQVLVSAFRKWQLKGLKPKGIEESPEKRNAKKTDPVFDSPCQERTKVPVPSSSPATSKNTKNSEESLKNTSDKDRNSQITRNGDCNRTAAEQCSGSLKRLDKAGETYNGAYCGKYWWMQSMTDLDVCVPVPPHVRKGNQIKVAVNHSEFLIKIKNESAPESWTTIIDDKLANFCNKGDTVWSLDSTRHLIQLHLEKSRDAWWDQLLISESKINMKEIEATRPFSELSEEEQITVSNLMQKEKLKQEARERGDFSASEIELRDVIQQVGVSRNAPFNLPSPSLQR